mgnify:CR=1 FL=1
MTLASFIEQLFNGIQYGMALFLVSSGLTLIFGIMNFINLAHGSQVMIGAYLSTYFAIIFNNFFIGILVAIPITFAVGYFIEILIVQYLYKRDHLEQVLASFGLILFFNELTVIIFGTSPLYSDIPEFLAGQIIFSDLDNQVMNLSNASLSFNNLVFVNEDTLARIKAYTFASLGESMDSVFSINLILNSKNDYHQNMQVRFYDNDGKEILHGSTILIITPIPNRYALGQNYPNPFNPSTTIQFELPEESYTQIAIYDLLGRELIQLVNEIYTAGYHQVIWNGKDSFDRTIPSGMYLYRMETNGFIRTRKLVFLK